MATCNVTSYSAIADALDEFHSFELIFPIRVEARVLVTDSIKLSNFNQNIILILRNLLIHINNLSKISKLLSNL